MSVSVGETTLCVGPIVGGSRSSAATAWERAVSGRGRAAAALRSWAVATGPAQASGYARELAGEEVDHAGLLLGWLCYCGPKARQPR